MPLCCPLPETQRENNKSVNTDREGYNREILGDGAAAGGMEAGITRDMS